MIRILCLALLLLCACKKNALGGDATISGTVVHHSKHIGGSKVYIKFNATEFPGSDVNAYDASTTAGSDGNYSFSVYKGDYYLYAVGEDRAVPPPYIVKGGTPVHIRSGEKVEATIAVTE
jgi:hypothetical protein